METLSRRRFLLAGAAAAGAAPFAGTAAAATGQTLQNLPALWPAPPVTLGSGGTPPPFAVRVLNKVAYGPRPGDVAAFEALGGNDTDRLSAWVDAQLNPGADPAVDNRVNPLTGSGQAYDTINKTASQLWTEHVRFDGDDAWQVHNRPRWQMERLTLLRAAYSDWPLREILADFWHNHFNVYANGFPVRSMLPEYDRQIRQHIFSNFYDMLLANSRTASMLYYLDNYANSWPHPNENYAREVLELHTLGAIENYYGAVSPSSVGTNSQGQRAGYTEIDVFEFAKALTGWGVADGDDDAPDTGAFLFRPDWHYDEHGTDPIQVMDVTIATDGGQNDVTDILQYLAGHYGTARYIAYKLCKRLIGDDPAESIVSSTADEFYSRAADNDQLREVYRHVLTSSEFMNAWGEKARRPIETVARVMRATGMDLTIRLDDNDSNDIINRLDDAGHLPFGWEPPTGYPDSKAIWQGSGPLIMSWRTVTRMLRFDEGVLNLAEQTNIMIPAPSNRTVINVVGQWATRALGYTPDSNELARIMQFVSDVTGASTFQTVDAVDTDFDTTDTSDNSDYQRLLRAVVGLLLMLPNGMRR